MARTSWIRDKERRKRRIELIIVIVGIVVAVCIALYFLCFSSTYEITIEK